MLAIAILSQEIGQQAKLFNIDKALPVSNFLVAGKLHSFYAAAHRKCFHAIILAMYGQSAGAAGDPARNSPTGRR
jgi:hypothetical protein